MTATKKKIVFISTHNLATNPRLVKEIKLALDNSFKVEVICFIFRNWSYAINESLITEFKNKGVQFHTMEAGKADLKNWAISVGKEKFNRFLSNAFSLKNNLLANAVSRRNVVLSKAINNVEAADWVIGHNPGALWATYVLGQKLQCKTGFDVEDYHPGEGNNKASQHLMKKLMQELLPKMNYVSFAAPLIMEEVKKDIQYENENWFTLLNIFSNKEFNAPAIESESPLKFVWFSQHINEGRGLELLLPAIKLAGAAVELHLFGNMDTDFKEQYLKDATNIFMHAPISQYELHQELAEYDIGLALEIPQDINRNLCLTNKLLAYVQAGLFVIYTNTKAQAAFMQARLPNGEVLEINKTNPVAVVQNLVENKHLIRSYRSKAYSDSLLQNWETASEKLLNAWNI